MIHFRRIGLLFIVNRKTYKKASHEIRFTPHLWTFSGSKTVNVILNQNAGLFVQGPNMQLIVYKKNWRES